MRKTKIIATLGPATDSVMDALVRAGVDVARLNLSHGSVAEHRERIALVEKARKKAGKPVPVLLDTRGPEIRTGYVEGFDENHKAAIALKRGKTVTFLCDEKNAVLKGKRSTPEKIYVSYNNLSKEVMKGTKVLIDDGKLVAKVVSAKGREIQAKIVRGGEITSRRGINVPGVKIGLSCLPEADRRDIKALVKRIDFLALSFARDATDVSEARAFLDANGGRDVKIVAKVENQQGVDNLEEILELADGVMVARGDLGVELPYERVPAVQRRMITRALRARKVVVTATQMLDSMMEHASPTRAEVSDVFNAVHESTTCLMLSGETAMGKYPVEAVKAMARIAEAAEKSIDYQRRFHRIVYHAHGHVTASVCYAAVATAYNVGARAVVAYSDTGHTAVNVSTFRPNIPIVVVSPGEMVVRQNQILWGVVPVQGGQDGSIAQLFEDAQKMAKRAGAERGDTIVAVAGTPVGVPGSTNTVRVGTIGNVLVRGIAHRKGVVSGRVRVCRTDEELGRLKRGEVAVVFKLAKATVPRLRKAAAVLVSGLHYEKAALAGLRVPVLVDVRGASKRLSTGMKVEVRGDKGVVLKA